MKRTLKRGSKVREIVKREAYRCSGVAVLGARAGRGNVPAASAAGLRGAGAGGSGTGAQQCARPAAWGWAGGAGAAGHDAVAGCSTRVLAQPGRWRRHSMAATIRPVLKHGPRSLTFVRACIWQGWGRRKHEAFERRTAGAQNDPGDGRCAGRVWMLGPERW
jgi:hypothetical protein